MLTSMKYMSQKLFVLLQKLLLVILDAKQENSDLHKVLGYFGAKHTKGKPTKDHEVYPVSRKMFNMQQGNNAIVNNVVDEILINEAQEVSAASEEPGVLYSDYDENDIY